jgi:hypothetical protein
VEEIMAFNKETLEKFPVTRMKLLHRNLISVSKELYELSEALDSENTYTNDLKDINNSLEAMCRNDIEGTLRRISNICSLLSLYTLSDKEN